MERTWKSATFSDITVLLYHTKENNCTLALMRTKQPLRTTTILHHSLSLKSLSSYARVLSATLLVWQLVAGGSVTSAGEVLLGSVQQPGSKHNTSPSASKSDTMDLTWSCYGLWLMSIYNLNQNCVGRCLEWNRMSGCWDNHLIIGGWRGRRSNTMQFMFASEHLLSWMAQQRCRNVIYNQVQQPSTANSTVLGRLFRCLAPSPKKAVGMKGRRSIAAMHLKLETTGAQQQTDFPVSFTPYTMSWHAHICTL